MAIASFDEEQKLIQQTSVTPQNVFRGMSGWLVKKGLASNQTSADLTLVVIAVIAITLSVFVFFKSAGNGSATIPRDVLNVYIQRMNSIQPPGMP